MKLPSKNLGNIMSTTAKKGDESYAGVAPSTSHSDADAYLMQKTEESSGTIERKRGRHGVI